MFNNDSNDPHRYDDMLDMPRHVSPTRPRMAALDRAAQFAPFAALTGYGEAIEETARRTDRRIEPGDAERAELSEKLRILRDRLGSHPVLSVTHFVPDRLKEGGRYETAAGALRKLSLHEYTLTLEGGEVIDLDNIIAIDGDIFDGVQF